MLMRVKKATFSSSVKIPKAKAMINHYNQKDMKDVEATYDSANQLLILKSDKNPNPIVTGLPNIVQMEFYGLENTEQNSSVAHPKRARKKTAVKKGTES